MRFLDIIEKKKRGLELCREEITEGISQFVAGEIPDYQMSAFLMAVYFQGMTDKECLFLTEAITNSGEALDLSSLGSLTTDKHSSGGVGDKTTLIVAPMAASVGCIVAKMSGRGLGHTGGTIDKLESLPGYKTDMTITDFLAQSKKVGIAVIGQAKDLTPADKLLYALRDVTATVDSIPLITASIMGKKLAAGSKNIILDVKCGSGAFMKTPEDAISLAKSMVRVGTLAGRNTTALVTDMSFPLGYAVGNSLEVYEAIDILTNYRENCRLTELCICLASHMAHAAFGGSISLWREKIIANIKNGKALEKFKEWISAQGADPKYAHNPELLLGAKYSFDVIAREGGYVTGCNAEDVGLGAMVLGAGRAKKDDIIDMSAGIVLSISRGSYIKPGDKIATLYSDTVSDFSRAEALVRGAYTLSESAPKEIPVVLSEIT